MILYNIIIIRKIDAHTLLIVGWIRERIGYPLSFFMLLINTNWDLQSVSLVSYIYFTIWTIRMKIVVVIILLI